MRNTQCSRKAMIQASSTERFYDNQAIQAYYKIIWTHLTKDNLLKLKRADKSFD